MNYFEEEMVEIGNEAQEYIVVQPLGEVQQVAVQSQSQEYTSWPRDVTKRLIDLYKEYHTQLGISIRRQKRLWEIIAEILNREFKQNLRPAQVENKWRTLLRAYKNVIDNNNKTGRSRKSFEWLEAMDTIYGKKRNIRPEILLSEETIVTPPKSVLGTAGPSTLNVATDESTVIEITPRASKTTITEDMETQVIRRRKKVVSRNEILEKIRRDKLKQHENYMNKMDERLEVERQKLFERKRSNNIQEERNRILKEYLEKNIPLPP